MVITFLNDRLYGKSKIITMLENKKVKITTDNKELVENVDFKMEDDMQLSVTLRYGSESNAYQVTIGPL